MAMVQAFVDQLAAARGLIINISSLSSVTPYLFGSVYCASKAAVSAYSRTLRMELAPLGVRVSKWQSSEPTLSRVRSSNISAPENKISQPFRSARLKVLLKWR